MTWRLTLIGDCVTQGTGPAVMSLPVSDYVHSHSAAADTVEQLVCEEFHDTYPQHKICEICWTYEDIQCRDAKGRGWPDHDYDDSDECTRCGALGEGWDE